MKAIKDLLLKNDLKVRKYHNIGNSTIIDTNDNKYVVRKKGNNEGIYEYLNSREYPIYPSIIDSNQEYIMYNYIQDNNIPDEQKINELIKSVAILHQKTSYTKSIDKAEYKKLYEDLSNNILYLKDYYFDIITLIDTKVYPNPAEYLLQRNISLIFSHINYCEERINSLYEKTKNVKKIRVALIHNNLSLDHFLQDNHNYLISWDKAKFEIPIFDLYKLYYKYGSKYDFNELISNYQKIFPLKESELILLDILINMPSKIEFNKNIYNMCINIKNELIKLNQAQNLINSP